MAPRIFWALRWFVALSGTLDVQEIPMPIGTAHASTHRMTGAQFRAFQETRPDRERWELVKGVPIMMVPPTIAHQRIADNLTRLLNDAWPSTTSRGLQSQRRSSNSEKSRSRASA